VTETPYKALPDLLAEIKGGTVRPVYLLYGDEFVYKSAFRSLLDAIIPPDHQDLNYEAVDGASESIYGVIQRLNTFPMIPSAKVIAVHETRVFYSSVVISDFFQRSQEAFEAENLKECAHYFLHMLSMAGMSIDDAQERNWKGISNKDLREYLEVQAEEKEGEGWLNQVISYCIQDKLAVPVFQDDAEVLNDAIQTGYPETNHLVLTADIVDKRRKLYKTIKKVGIVVDCSVPKGDRKADKQKQEAALRGHMKNALKKAGKTMAPGGFEVLYEKIGANIRSFSTELDKVVTFVGEREEISASDVETTSERTKEDPIYEMSNAVAERDTPKALFFLNSLLQNNVYPLQVLAVVANQIRKLILAKDFIHGMSESGWKKDLSYKGFEKAVLPKLEKREPDILTSNVHPYAVYMTFRQSSNYTMAELTGALELLLDADIRLKTSGQDAKVVLENATLLICGDEESHMSQSSSIRE
jgi:DNA polymerase-3 subunit delta